MSAASNDNPGGQVPLLPDERFELSLDAKRGAVNAAWAGPDSLTITTHRAIRQSTAAGHRTTKIMPLDRLTGIDVVDAARPSERLTHGLIALGVAVAFGWVSWVVVAIPVVSLVLGGFPALVAIYLLAGYAFPDDDGMLVLHAGGHTLEQTLLSNDAKRDAYLVAHRLYELSADARRSAPQPVVTSPPRAADIAAPTPAATSSVAANGASDELGMLLRLTPGPVDGQVPAANVSEKIADCILAVERARAYTSRRTVRDAAHEELGIGDFVWDVEHKAPDTFRVSQRGWDTFGEVLDAWTVIDGDCYREGDGWHRVGDSSGYAQEVALTRSMRVTRYVPLLRGERPDSAVQQQGARGSYLVLEYASLSRDTLAILLDDPSPPQGARGSARLWVEDGSGLLAKVEFRLEGVEGRGFIVEQAFASYDAPLQIERPLPDTSARSSG